MLVIREKKCRIANILVLGALVFRLRQVRVILTVFNVFPFRVAVVGRQAKIAMAASHNAKMQRSQQRKPFGRKTFSLKASVALDNTGWPAEDWDSKSELGDAIGM